ncbi:MAG: hypothetical protein JEY79_07645 [Pseudodesulfovibrio sp.]|nr:hypothetical protein [Pseudodesulfovibrio sp.]MBI9079596.1 hypothetical protein [Pseudodesulfovibrio sp.]
MLAALSHRGRITAQKKRLLLTFGRFGPKVSRAGGTKLSVYSLWQPWGCIPFCFYLIVSMKNEDEKKDA